MKSLRGDDYFGHFDDFHKIDVEACNTAEFYRQRQIPTGILSFPLSRWSNTKPALLNSMQLAAKE
ncbi:MAG: hypothetical protein ACKVP0_07895 [Pirellulaceae bacterium]